MTYRRVDFACSGSEARVKEGASTAWVIAPGGRDLVVGSRRDEVVDAAIPAGG